jgi:hypothetical protein
MIFAIKTQNLGKWSTMLVTIHVEFGFNRCCCFWKQTFSPVHIREYWILYLENNFLWSHTHPSLIPNQTQHINMCRIIYWIIYVMVSSYNQSCVFWVDFWHFPIRHLVITLCNTVNTILFFQSRYKIPL